MQLSKWTLLSGRVRLSGHPEQLAQLEVKHAALQRDYDLLLAAPKEYLVPGAPPPLDIGEVMSPNGQVMSPKYQVISPKWTSGIYDSGSVPD